ncbi:MAG: hypothetical protein HJHJAOHD_00703 [Flavobacteriales bacterium]|nr:hypothetical protein [Flavobacteriales bacterium]
MIEELNPASESSKEMIEETFKFWFTSNHHIRSPFPEYIHDKLKTEGTEKFWHWALNLKPEAEKELNEEIIAERLEEIIFETALKLVLTEDEKITIRYPFLPRIGDTINAKDTNEASNVVDRWIVKEGDNEYLKVTLSNNTTNEKWETKFELMPS